MGADPIEDRASSGRDGEGPEPSPSTALRAGSASKSMRVRGGPPNASRWLGRPAESAERGPGPSQPPEIASVCGLAMTDPSPNPLPREREIWIGRFAPFNQAPGLAMTDPSPPEPRAHAWVQGKHTLYSGRGKCGLDVLRPSTNWPGGRRSARRGGRQAARDPEPLVPLGFRASPEPLAEPAPYPSRATGTRLGLRASLDVCRGRADRAGAEHLPAGEGAAQRGSRLILRAAFPAPVLIAATPVALPRYS